MPSESPGEAGDGCRPAGQVLAALADPTRCQALTLLSTEAQSASALSRVLPISRTAVLKHLAVLERNDLVRRRQVGREVRYVLRTERLTATGHWISELAAAWDTRLAALQRLAEDCATS